MLSDFGSQISCCGKQEEYTALKEQDVEGARRAVSIIVGRDTQSLTSETSGKSSGRNCGRNTSDGVTAPLLFLMLGGVPLGFLYKAVNTMDSMLGYKNEKNLYFGRVAAKMDDVFNYLPSRLSGLFDDRGSLFSEGMKWKECCSDLQKRSKK